ncbi:MAG: hypothetical protein J0M17_09860 [Planctomycetes bacterium]|nr:hypothetical protein [Planctomycetota bacterium]
MSHKCCTALLLLVTINVLSILWPRIRPQSHSIASPPTLVSIANTENKDRRADVIFVHGLGGDGRHTWESLDDSKFYWPQALGEDLTDVGIWTVNYESAASHWLGYTMPIESRAMHLLQVLKDHDIGERRIVFIGHSLGGIVVKQMIQDASDLGIADYSDIAMRTRGVIFLGTPNTGSDLPSAQKMIEKLGIYTGATVTQDQLVDNSPILLRLNLWYRNRVESMEIKTQAFAETKPFNGVIVVDQSSADPQVAGIAVVPVPENHQTICKPASKQADVYVAVKRFIDEHVVPLPSEYKSTLQEAVTEISLCRNDPARLEQFKEAHVGQEVVWEGFVQKVAKDKKDSYCTLSLRGDADPFRWVVASFRYWNFKPTIAPGATIKVRGILKKVDETNILISECRLVP